MALIASFFIAGIVTYAVGTYRAHKKAHLDPEWAKQHLRHHYDHHMGQNQDANWCVTQPWFDHLLGTRIEYEYDEQGRARPKPEAKPADMPLGVPDNLQLGGKVAA